MCTETKRRVALLLTATALSLLASACSAVTYSEDFDRRAPVAQTGTWAWKPVTPAQERALAAISPFLQRRIERAVERELGERGFTLASDDGPDYLVSAYPSLPDRTAGPAWRARRSPPARVNVGFSLGFARPYGWGYPYPYRWWGSAFWPALSYWNPYSWYLGAGWIWGRPNLGYPAFGWAPGYSWASGYSWAPGYGWAPAFGYGPYGMGGYARRARFDSGDRGPGALVIDVIDAATGKVLWEGLAEGALLDPPSGDELEAYVDRVVGRTLRGFPPAGD